MLGTDTTKGAPDDWYRFLRVSLSFSFFFSLSLCFVPRMGSVCVPGRISMREEGGGDGGQRGGAVRELELAQEVCHTLNGRMKNSHSKKKI